MDSEQFEEMMRLLGKRAPEILLGLYPVLTSVELAVTVELRLEAIRQAYYLMRFGDGQQKVGAIRFANELVGFRNGTVPKTKKSVVIVEPKNSPQF